MHHEKNNSRLTFTIFFKKQIYLNTDCSRPDELSHWQQRKIKTTSTNYHDDVGSQTFGEANETLHHDFLLFSVGFIDSLVSSCTLP